MVLEFIDSALIIDDKPEEIQKLKELLEENDIWVKHKLPEDCVKELKNRKIIFLDIYLSNTATELKGHIAEIRKIFKNIVGKNFGTYGLVVWTNHQHHIDTIKEKLQLDKDTYSLPLFICGLDKQKYLRDGYDNLLNDLDNELRESIAAHFFISWSRLVNQGRDNAISSIFDLVPDYTKQDKNLEFLLFKLAQNYTGISLQELDDYPLSIDAIKAFNDMLVYNINSISENFTLFTKTSEIEYLDNENKSIKAETKKTVSAELYKIYAKINSSLLVDQVHISQNKVIPGNVYEVMQKENSFRYGELPEGASPIIIEMTPPCDYANNKSKSPRVLAGYYHTCNSKRQLPDSFYKELWPIFLEGKNEPQIIVFDFRILGFISKEELNDENKYKLLFRVKEKLFADVLQKMASHTARLGLSIIR